MDLTTAARVATLVVPGETAPSAFNTVIGQVITAVSAAAERYLGRWAQTTSRTEYMTVVPGKRVYRLRAFPVTTLTSAYIDIDQQFGADTALGSDDYYNPTYSTDGTFTLKFFPAVIDTPVPAALKITYTGGMATTTANFISGFPDIAHAIDLQCAHIYHTRNYAGTLSQSGDSGSVSIQTVDWLPEVKATLDRYRVRAL